MNFVLGKLVLSSLRRLCQRLDLYFTTLATLSLETLLEKHLYFQITLILLSLSDHFDLSLGYQPDFNKSFPP